MDGTPLEMQEREQQMMHFSNATSRHVRRLIKYMLEEQQVFLNDDQPKIMRLQSGSAEPSQMVTAILDEKLSFTMRCSGPYALLLVLQMPPDTDLGNRIWHSNEVRAKDIQHHSNYLGLSHH